MEYQLSFTKIFDALWAGKLLVVAAAVISMLLGLLFVDLNAPDMYMAQTTLYSASSSSYRESIEGFNAMRDYVDIVSSRKVAERASSLITHYDISPDAIMHMVSAVSSTTSAIITIRAQSENPEIALLVANAISEAFMQEVYNVASDNGVKVLDPAYRTSMTSNGTMSAIRTCAIMTIIGGVLAALFIAAKAALDKRVATYREVTLDDEIDLLGVIPAKKI